MYVFVAFIYFSFIHFYFSAHYPSVGSVKTPFRRQKCQQLEVHSKHEQSNSKPPRIRFMTIRTRYSVAKQKWQQPWFRHVKSRESNGRTAIASRITLVEIF